MKRHHRLPVGPLLLLRMHAISGMTINGAFQGIQSHPVIALEKLIAGHGRCMHLGLLPGAGDQCAKHQLLDRRK
jgi:hypothetical protein